MAASPRPDSDRPSSAPGQLSLDHLCINTIRTLAMDAVQKANSGHPGTPMALAPVAYTLWQDFLRFDPADPTWPNRDRFVLSCGHASMLLYSLLHLTGVAGGWPTAGHAVTLDDIKHFRQLDSPCPGHPEYRLTSGVETTTGPLGQGVATSVGMAIGGALAGRALQPARLRAVRLRRLRAVQRRRHDGGHLQRGGLARRASAARRTSAGSTTTTTSRSRARPTWPSARMSARASRPMAGLCTMSPTPTIAKRSRGAGSSSRRPTDRPTLIIVEQPYRLRRAAQAGHPEAHGEPLGEEEIG